MFLTPLNFIFSSQLVPVFEWEPVERADGASPPAPAPVSCEGAPGPTPSSDAPSPTDLRLVFKGYEWRPVGERAVHPRADWESVLRSEADAKEEERDPTAHRNDPTRRQAPPRPVHDGPDGCHNADKADPSEAT
jgi:hypothetical protein